ncbi:DNA-binding transcriptional regulator, XRE-family HTH domain [Treponema bryantii]|uniref:DNA-binding transcriptional regulator, XRE-family HTH domain n=1 Tax=Treponema bryantii TaxID=163 RepID=A0A1I3K7E3_9SPIR|nr:helix-turn-helix transcriptional regulator [Treponema bryantii]SFI68367.1 DNA-binding transcriptional regulator, XRE-family HTH domain [Treponema bryantii]
MDFMNNVLNELQKNNMTQIELCDAIGISINTFRGWVSKKVQPPVDIAYKISKELNTTVDQLVSGKPEHPAEKKLNEVKQQLNSIIGSI